jgi:hypothetical protein
MSIVHTSKFNGGERELEETLLARVLDRKLSLGNEALIDHVIERGESSVPVRNLCAKVTEQLYDDVDSYSRFLGISKRRFVEMALIAALDKAEKIMRERCEEVDQ